MTVGVCSKVVDLTTYDTIVVIGCLLDDGTGNSGGTLIWNTAYNKLEVLAKVVEKKLMLKCCI